MTTKELQNDKMYELNEDGNCYQTIHQHIHQLKNHKMIQYLQMTHRFVSSIEINQLLFMSENDQQRQAKRFRQYQSTLIHKFVNSQKLSCYLLMKQVLDIHKKIQKNGIWGNKRNSSKSQIQNINQVQLEHLEEVDLYVIKQQKEQQILKFLRFFQITHKTYCQFMNNCQIHKAKSIYILRTKLIFLPLSQFKSYEQVWAKLKKNIRNKEIRTSRLKYE